MTVSSAMQRYAAEIYRLQQDYKLVPLSLLDTHVETSAQAISKMVKRLSENGYLVHKPYHGVHLTSAGEKIAMPALRRHRLAEVFLVKVMGYDWASAHELSDTFEQGFNENIEDRVFELAGRPTRCPHGEPIPTKEGIMPEIHDEPLVDIPSGSDCIISRVRTHDSEKLRYIADLGLIPGVPFYLLSCAPFQGPLRLQMKSGEHVIGYELSKTIWVEIVKKGKGNKLPPLEIPPV
jgi:DtxR family Mn-dependent transcriptional regulator